MARILFSLLPGGLPWCRRVFPVYSLKGRRRRVCFGFCVLRVIFSSQLGTQRRAIKRRGSYSCLFQSSKLKRAFHLSLLSFFNYLENGPVQLDAACFHPPWLAASPTQETDTLPPRQDKAKYSTRRVNAGRWRRQTTNWIWHLESL